MKERPIMRVKKIIPVLAIGIIIPGLTGNIIAVTDTGTTPVTYDNRNEIPDPDSPITPEWAVTIPSTVSFSDDRKVIDTSVELISKNGGVLPTEDVSVTVASTNNYKLKMGSEAVSYKLIYTDTMDNEGMTTVAKLNKENVKQEGKAVLGKDKASKLGEYTDTLTYSVSGINP